MLFNNQYNIAVEGEATNILSHFNDDYILNVVADNIDRRLTSYMSIINLISSIETNIMHIIDTYPHQKDDIMNRRENIYGSIINIIVNRFNIEYGVYDFIDNKNSAYYMYELFISSFKDNLINLFTSIIFKEKNNIFNILESNGLKRKKDSSTTYGKKMYNNPKLAVINANLEESLEYVFSLNLNLSDILNNIYDNKSIIKHLELTISPRGDIYRELFVLPFKQDPMLKVNLINDIRLNIHKILTTNI